MFNIKKHFPTKTCITNVFRINNDYIENKVYKKYDNRTFNKPKNITEHLNNHSNDITNNYNMNKNKQCKGNVLQLQ